MNALCQSLASGGTGVSPVPVWPVPPGQPAEAWIAEARAARANERPSP
jgi:hypothetical protein